MFVEEHLCYLKSLLKSREIMMNTQTVYVYTNDYIYYSISDYWKKNMNLEDKRKMLNVYDSNALNDYLHHIYSIIAIIFFSILFTIYLMVISFK